MEREGGSSDVWWKTVPQTSGCNWSPENSWWGWLYRVAEWAQKTAPFSLQWMDSSRWIIALSSKQLWLLLGVPSGSACRVTSDGKCSVYLWYWMSMSALLKTCKHYRHNAVHAYTSDSVLSLYLYVCLSVCLSAWHKLQVCILSLD